MLSIHLKNENIILSSKIGSGNNRRSSDNTYKNGFVLTSFIHARDKNIQFSGFILKANAEQFANTLFNQDSKAIGGWQIGLKKETILLWTECGESGAVNIQAADNNKKNPKNAKGKYTKIFVM